MTLTTKQKELRDKKVEELNNKIFAKTEQKTRGLADAQSTADKLQSEIDEANLIKQALEALK